MTPLQQQSAVKLLKRMLREVEYLIEDGTLEKEGVDDNVTIQEVREFICMYDNKCTYCDYANDRCHTLS